MAIDKSTRQHYAMQGKIRNYLGKQKMVKAPKKWKSGPDHPDTELAYITKAEKDLILKADLHNSLSKGPNRGPSGIISLNSAGSGYSGPGRESRDSSSTREDRISQQYTPAPKPAPTRSRQESVAREEKAKADKVRADVREQAAQRSREEAAKKADIKNMIKSQQEEKYGDTADPTKFGETIPDIDRVMSIPEGERTIEDKLKIEDWEKAQDYDKVKDLSKKGHSFEDIQKAMDKGLLTKADPQSMQTNLLSRGIRNIIPETGLERSLLGGLKKSFVPTDGGMFDPKKTAFNLARNYGMKKLGLGWLNPALGIASLFGFDPMGWARNKFASKPVDMSAFNKLELQANRVPTPKETLTARDPKTIAQKIATGEVDLNKLITGENEFKDIKGHRADLSATDIKLINYGKKHGLTTPTEIKETVGADFNQKKPPTDAEIKGVLEGTITKPTGIFAAYGGRIDKPLMGRSRDI